MAADGLRDVVAEIGDYLGPLDPDKMTDTGMWIWAAILTVVGLAASYLIAVAWQRHKDRKKERA